MQDFPVPKKVHLVQTVFQFLYNFSSNILHVTLEISAEKHVYLHVNNLLIRCDLKPNWRMLRTFSTVLYYETLLNTFSSS